MKKLLLILFLCSTMLVTLGSVPPPPPPYEEDPNTTVPIGGAPIGSGVFILAGLALAYGARKAYSHRRKLSN